MATSLPLLLGVLALVSLVSTTSALVLSNSAVGGGDCATDCSACKDQFECVDETHSTTCVWGLPADVYDSMFVGGSDPIDSVCRPMECHDIVNNEETGDTATACVAQMGGNACQWYDEEYTCFAKDKPLPCELKTSIYTKSSCTSYAQSNNLDCVWTSYDSDQPSPNDDEGQCRSQSALSEPHCGLYSWEDGCKGNSGCTWYEKEVSGEPSTNDPEPATEYCTACFNSTFGSEPPCDALEDMPKPCCPSRCKWVITEGGNGDEYEDIYNGKCIDKDETLACENFYGVQECNANPDCRWIGNSEYGGECIGKDEKVKCFQLALSACKIETTCNWTTSNGESTCIDCPQGKDCHEEPPAPGDCSSYTPEECPEDGICTLRYPDDGGDNDMEDFPWQCSSTHGTCAKAGCDEIYDEDQCKSTDGCTYDSDYFECYNASNIDCSMFYEQGMCTKHSECTFSKYSDVLKGNACLDDMDDTEGVCHKSGENPSCLDLPAYESFCCPDFCSWDDDEFMCADKSGGGGGGGNSRSCASYGLAGHGSFEDACPDSCDIVKGLCVDNGVSISCDDICDELACDGVGGVSTGCKWTLPDENNPYEGKCVEGSASPKDCVGSTEDECYDNERCVYLYGGDSGEGLCMNAVCSDMTEEFCKASEPSCKWDTEDYRCYFSDMARECSDFYDQDCPTNNGCKLLDACNYNICVESSVTDKSQLACELFDEEDCCGQQSNCKWDSDAYTCALDKSLVPGVPTLDGKGDKNPQVCLDKKTGSTDDQAYYAKVEAALNDAALDCAGPEYNYNNVKATDEQLKCLSHYVVDVANTDFQSICPCLYLWADKINPSEDHWMQINC